MVHLWVAALLFVLGQWGASMIVASTIVPSVIISPLSHSMVPTSSNSIRVRSCWTSRRRNFGNVVAPGTASTANSIPKTPALQRRRTTRLPPLRPKVRTTAAGSRYAASAPDRSVAVHVGPWSKRLDHRNQARSRNYALAARYPLLAVAFHFRRNDPSLHHRNRFTDTPMTMRTPNASMTPRTELIGVPLKP